jgi:hypothetical protein
MSDTPEDATEDVVTDPVQPTEETPEEEIKPTVRAYPEGWHLVEHGSWQVSVAPDGLLMLPRHLQPHEAEDFAKAILAAKDVGHEVVRANARKTTPVVEQLESSVFVTESGKEAPGIKALIQQRGPQKRYEAAIGRPRPDPRQPRVDAPATPQGPGARRGRQK